MVEREAVEVPGGRAGWRAELTPVFVASAGSARDSVQGSAASRSVTRSGLAAGLEYCWNTATWGLSCPLS